MKLFRIITAALIFCFLTILTQIGGIIYLLSFTTHKFIHKKFHQNVSRVSIKLLSFLILYFVATFSIVPPLAKPFGRVPMPLTQTNNLRPLNIITCLLNRHYVRPQLRQTAFDAARQMGSRYPGTVINYLDAGFPFINKFPLFPHLSHNDGRKLDFAFCYTDAQTGKAVNIAPSPIGYGISEGPLSGEVNTAAICSGESYRFYSMMKALVPQGNKKNVLFDAERTTALVKIFAEQPAVNKIFIEPHLKTRLHLTGDKIRFHGCQAVRHDDHFHVEVK